eukprot:4233614-Amphidinium_carterae.1
MGGSLLGLWAVCNKVDNSGKITGGTSSTMAETAGKAMLVGSKQRVVVDAFSLPCGPQLRANSVSKSDIFPRPWNSKELPGRNKAPRSCQRRSHTSDCKGESVAQSSRGSAGSNPGLPKHSQLR